VANLQKIHSILEKFYIPELLWDEKPNDKKDKIGIFLIFVGVKV
jgi:hypothetical protein